MSVRSTRSADRDPRRMQRVARAPTWSAALTIPLAARVPVEWRPAALTVVKAVHTAAFVSIAGSIVLFTWDGFRRRRRLRSRVAAAVAIAETVIYATNNQVCPLSPLAEELGARRGSVTDLFLPARVSARIPAVSLAVLLMGLAFNVRTWLASEPGRRSRGRRTRR